MYRSFLITSLFLLQTLHGLALSSGSAAPHGTDHLISLFKNYSFPAITAYNIDKNVMNYIKNCYTARGIDITDLPPFYMKPDLQKIAGAPIEAAYASNLSTGTKSIYLSPDFNRELTEQVNKKKVNPSLRATLLHEIGHHKQNEAHKMLDAIRGQLSFTIDDIKYEEAAAEVFAYKHMYRSEILALNAPFEEDHVRNSFRFIRAIHYFLGGKIFQKFLENQNLADKTHLNILEEYKLRAFIIAHNMCLPERTQRISTRHHSHKKKSARKHKKR